MNEIFLFFDDLSVLNVNYQIQPDEVGKPSQGNVAHD